MRDRIVEGDIKMEAREAKRLISDVTQLQRVLASAEAGLAAVEAKLERAMADGEAARMKAAAYLADVRRQLDEAREKVAGITEAEALAAGYPGHLAFAQAQVATAEAEAN